MLAPLLSFVLVSLYLSFFLFLLKVLLLLPTGRARRARAKDLRPRGRDPPSPRPPPPALRGPRPGRTDTESRGPAGTALGGRSGRSGRRGGERGGPGSPVAGTVPSAGRPEPASLARSPAVMVADQRLPRVPAEPGTIPRLCALLLGAQETKRKCQEHVNQTRYSVTIRPSGVFQAPAPRAHRPDTCAGPSRLPGGPADPGVPPSRGRRLGQTRGPGPTILQAAGACPGPGLWDWSPAP